MNGLSELKYTRNVLNNDFITFAFHLKYEEHCNVCVRSHYLRTEQHIPEFKEVISDRGSFVC